jgi:hypothetical protein
MGYISWSAGPKINSGHPARLADAIMARTGVHRCFFSIRPGLFPPGLNCYQMASTPSNWMILWSAVTTGRPNSREVATMIWSAGSR